MRRRIRLSATHLRIRVGLSVGALGWCCSCYNSGNDITTFGTVSVQTPERETSMSGTSSVKINAYLFRWLPVVIGLLELEYCESAAGEIHVTPDELMWQNWGLLNSGQWLTSNFRRFRSDRKRKNFVGGRGCNRRHNPYYYTGKVQTSLLLCQVPHAVAARPSAKSRLVLK